MKLHRVIFLLAIQLVLPIGVAASDFDHDYEHYERLLQQHVDSGLVDYRSIKQHRALLDSTNARFGRVSIEQFDAFTPDQQMAYLLNAYNFFTIVAIVDAYPVESIKDINGVWDDMAWPVAGRSLTLDNIEHDILRKQFDDARIHAAVVCASISCPALWEHAFTADSLDAQLEQRSEAFVRDTSRNRFAPEENKLYLSKIFDWYGKDFISQYGQSGLFAYLDDKKQATTTLFYQHVATEAQNLMRAARLKVSYLDYDWSLNERR